jgi:hypothetical protein
MKIIRIAKLISLGVLAIIVVAILALVVWAKYATYSAGRVALSATVSSSKVNISKEKWIVFEPVQATETGLIFYPGGLVDPIAYAPILRKIAQNGVLVIITPMPLNLAIFNTSVANDVIERYSQIETWVIAGHSLGGASAAIYVENYPTKVTALALWDSYPADSSDLSDNAISVISVFGTTDNIPNTANFNDKKHLLPSESFFIGIEGANHSQFGDYGFQKGDVGATLSMADQHEMVAEIMLEFIDAFQ